MRFWRWSRGASIQEDWKSDELRCQSFSLSRSINTDLESRCEKKISFSITVFRFLLLMVTIVKYQYFYNLMVTKCSSKIHDYFLTELACLKTYCCMYWKFRKRCSVLIEYANSCSLSRKVNVRHIDIVQKWYVMTTPIITSKQVNVSK